MQAAVMLSAFALLCAATSLAVVLARGPGLAAQASPVPPRTPLQAPPAGLLALAGVELLLPHLSRPFPFPRPPKHTLHYVENSSLQVLCQRNRSSFFPKCTMRRFTSGTTSGKI
jgi:hypothetical protein